MPDARVQAAVDHWAPRFVQAGVDYNDFVATTARVETWDEWLPAWCANADMHAGMAEEAADPRARPERGRGVGARDGGLPLREVRVGGRSRAQPRGRGPGGGRDGDDPRVPGSGRRARGGAARRRPGGGQPAQARGGRRAPAARAARARARFDEGGVLPARGRLPRPRHGHPLDRRARAGRVGLRAADQARLRGRRGRRARRDRRPDGRRPRPGGPARGEPRRLLRAAACWRSRSACAPALG